MYISIKSHAPVKSETKHVSRVDFYHAKKYTALRVITPRVRPSRGFTRLLKEKASENLDHCQEDFGDKFSRTQIVW